MNKLLNRFSLLALISFCLTGNSAFSSDNVLQAIQINGIKDTYNIVLKSDDVAEIKKTIQAPNKMIITLKGIRASKAINTIYNNTSSVDSVIVEPIGDDSVKILVQGNDVKNASVYFDSLKTPLGVLDDSQTKENSTEELVLNKPMESYKPVYNNGFDEDESSGISTIVSSESFIRNVKKIAKNEKISWMIVMGLFAIIILNALKGVKSKDSDIKVGLSQSLKDREIELYGSVADSSLGLNGSQQNLAGANYGIRAYQDGTRSPYLSAEAQRPRAITPTPSPVSPQPIQQMVKNLSAKPAQNTQVQGLPQQITNQGMSASTSLRQDAGVSKPRTTNIDSIKFLESMTKIYEKNGRADLAQGLKANMKKAKSNLV